MDEEILPLRDDWMKGPGRVSFPCTFWAVCDSFGIWKSLGMRSKKLCLAVIFAEAEFLADMYTGIWGQSA